MAEPAYVPKPGETVLVTYRFLEDGRPPFVGETVTVIDSRSVGNPISGSPDGLVTCHFKEYERRGYRMCLVLPAGGVEEAEWRLK